MLELIRKGEVKVNEFLQQAGIATGVAGLLGAVMVGFGWVPSSTQMLEVKTSSKQNYEFVNQIRTEQAVMKNDIKYIKESVTVQADTLKEILAETKKRR
tara:strand:+ start:1147 stop:1443 length:297 start_codon:yes stop_codon:yes gene_type:complete